MKTAHTSILLVLAAINCAHAASSAIPSGLDSEKIDRNSVCLELLRVGLSGPGCEADSSRFVEDAMATPPLVTVALLRKLRKMCPVLCSNEVTSLWPDLCACDHSTSKSKPVMDMDAICNAFCEQSMVLNGCLCEPAPSPPRHHHSKNPMIRGPSGIEGSGDGGGGQVETTTEPDWEQLCASLCRVGEGGALCNCDKPVMMSQL